MILRRLTCEDIAEAAKLHAASFETAWSEDSLKDHIKDDMCLGLFAPDVIPTLIGFCIARPVNDQAEIITIAVDPAQRGQGVGYRLMAQTFETLKSSGVSVLFLEVAEDNAAAKALYDRCGFTPIGKRPAYYRREGGRVAALTFRKDL